ncbi:hypothetical protein FOCC_FOCC014919 [Frankliniella occidentalis]|nr:hypothetical protein FOCC_FOCC014919 [Frankliniella occidentalis]
MKAASKGTTNALASFLSGKKDPLEEQRKYAEDIFPDSKTAQGITLKRTKGNGIVINVLGKEHQEIITAKLRKYKFSILTDVSTDVSLVKNSCVLVIIYDDEEGAIVTDYWDLHQIFSDKDPDGAEEGASAWRIFGLLKASFDKQQVPWTNVIGYAADGASVLMGSKNSYQNVYAIICTCVRVKHVNNCPAPPRIWLGIYNFFHNSSKRPAQFAEFQTFLHLDVLRMLHPSQTRWLSLTAVVDRILKQWDALRLYFDTKWLEERLETAERIHTMLNDKFTKIYDFNDPVLSRVSSLAPAIALSQRARETTPSLRTWALLLPRIVDKNDKEKLQDLDDQWRALPFAAEKLPQEVRECKDAAVFWHQMYIHENEIGERPYATLAKSALEVLSVPIPNADCERKFSKINDIKTKKRNKLLTKSINGTLHADALVHSGGRCCKDFKPTKSMYSKMLSANLYDFSQCVELNGGESDGSGSAWFLFYVTQSIG